MYTDLVDSPSSLWVVIFIGYLCSQGSIQEMGSNNFDRYLYSFGACNWWVLVHSQLYGKHAVGWQVMESIDSVMESLDSVMKSVDSVMLWSQ